jgi:diguanylate cyclase (GGDEF)-like protein
LNPAPADLRPEPAAERLARRRQMRLRMLKMIAASYAVDTLLLVAFVFTGTVGGLVPMAYALATGAALAGFHVAFSTGWSERYTDHYLTLLQMFVHSAICVGFTVAVPQVGVLVMTVFFCIGAFCALRPSTREVMLGAAVSAVAMGIAIVMVGDRLSLPAATVGERIVSALWITLMFGRCTIVGLYGARIRIAMLQSRQELARAYETVERLARRDELTGVLNRRALMELIEAEQQRLERGGPPYGVALLDLDHFKRINDVHGHLVGDEVLRVFVRTVAGATRAVDRLGRYGGEEFMLLLQGAGDAAEAHAALERARGAVVRQAWGDIAPGLQLTVSIGAALARRGESVEQLLTRADQALYRAKGAGRDRTVVSDD